MGISGYRNRKVFLTGASGFIGGFFLKVLLKEGLKVRVLLNKKDINIVHPKLEKVWGDINSGSVKKYLKGIDIVVHLAAYTGSLKDKNGDKFIKINYFGTKNLYTLASKRKIRFVYCSSIVVKGKSEALEKDWYAKSKLLATSFIKEGKYKNWTVVYPTAVIDLEQAQNGRIPGFLMARIGFGERLMNVVDVRSVANALFEIIKHPRIRGEYVFGGVNIKVSDYLKKMAKIKNTIYLPIRLPQWVVRYLVLIFFGRINLYNLFCKKFVSQKVWSKKAIKDLNYNPKKGLEMLID